VFNPQWLPGSKTKSRLHTWKRLSTITQNANASGFISAWSVRNFDFLKVGAHLYKTTLEDLSTLQISLPIKS
jgi:hypothetical protein